MKFAERQEMEKLCKNKKDYPCDYIHSYLAIRNFKDQLIYNGLLTSIGYLSSIYSFE